MPSTDTVILDHRRFSIRQTRPLWIGVATAVLMIAGVGEFALMAELRSCYGTLGVVRHG